MARPLRDVESQTFKKEFYETYKANGGYSYAAAKLVGVDYSTAHYWMSTDPSFKAITDSVKGMMIDVAEAELYKRATKNSDRDACLLFYLKTKGRERGYVERHEVTNTVQGDFKVNEADVDAIERIKQEAIEQYKASLITNQ